MAETLKEPPLVEALFELQLKPSAGWDLTVAGLMFERFRSEFPEKAQVLAPPAHALPIPAESLGAFLRVQLKRADGTAMIQIGQNLLAFNQLRPYPGWDGFKRTALEVVQGFVDTGPRLEPARVGLRYINLIGPLSPGVVDPSRISTLLPAPGGAFVGRSAGFYLRHELVRDAPQGRLVIQLGTERRDESPYVVLDLDFISAAEELAQMTSQAALSEWLEGAHVHIGKAFRDSITDAQYTRFQAGDGGQGT